MVLPDRFDTLPCPWHRCCGFKGGCGMQRLLWVTAVLFGSSIVCNADCIKPTPDEEAAIRHAFRTILLDNESARFSDTCKFVRTRERKEPTTTFCGLINAKNSYGAYSGFREYYSIPETDGAGFLQEEDDLSGVPSLGYCLACFDPEPTIHECFDIRLNAIKHSAD